MTPRDRRLVADHEELRKVHSEHLSVFPIGADRPESYRVTYNLRGVTLGLDGQAVMSDRQQVLFLLSARYPRERPALLAETAIFHPNVPPAIGHQFMLYGSWTPADSLWDVVVRMADVIQFRQYDVAHAQNSVATAWVTANPQVFPIGHVDLAAAVSTSAEAPPQT